MMRYIIVIAVAWNFQQLKGEEVRLLDLEPNDAQNLIEQQDQTLKYAPKIDSNVPAIRFLGEEPHKVLEDIYLAKQYHGQDGIGGYLYGYQVPDIAKNEQKKPSGDLKGAYNYINGAGQEIKVEYWDNGMGFHQIDNVPKILPKQIDDSPEVKAAKDAFMKRWLEEAERNTHPVQEPYNSEGQYASGPLSAQGQKERAEFFARQEQQRQNQPQRFPQAASVQQNAYPQQQQYQKAGVSQQTSGLPQYQGAASSQQSTSVRQQQYQAAASSPQAATVTHQQYQGAASAQPIAYAQQPQPQSQGQDSEGSYSPDNEGKYVPEEGEESTGPPKGFFYAFDYPVGIITQDQGRALDVEKSGSLKNLYEQNKQRFERQLEQGSAKSGSQYIITRK